MARLFPGQLAKIDAEDRLCVPRDLLKQVSWWQNTTVQVVAELTERGLVRVYSARAVAEAIPDGEQSGSESEYVAHAAIADRYRQLSLYADGRLRMTKEICPWLGYRLGQQTELYVQPFPLGFEVMTLEHRFARLDARSKDVLPWTYEV